MRKGGAEAVPGYLESILEYISEALEGITEALEHIQGYIRGYSGIRVSPVASRLLGHPVAIYDRLTHNT